MIGNSINNYIMNDINKPKKRGRPKKNASTNDIDVPSNEKELEKIEDLFNMALLEYVNDIEKKIYDTKFSDFSNLKTIIGEYLETFSLYGYDLNGNRVEIFHEKNDKDGDALNEFLKNKFVRSQIKSQNNLGNDIF